MMSTGEDEPSSGLNGRLRPRKLNIPSPLYTKSYRKTDVKFALETKSKRTSTASKVFPNKPDDLTQITDTPAPQILCPYCDRNFIAKQAASKHIRNTHILTADQDRPINCLFCNHIEDDGNEIIRHMIDNHPNQYFACYDCHTRFPSTTELAEHTLNACEKQKLPYRNKLRQKTTPKKITKTKNINGTNEYGSDDKNYTAGNGFNGIVISCELKPSHLNDPADIEDNITTNLILPSTKSISNTNVIDKNAVIVLDDLQWNKRIPSNFSFHNADADQILSRLGVVHRSPRTGESNRREWFKCIDESTQKFEKCFDTSFYSKVASNVQENLMKFLDGSFNFNPDAENTIKTRKAKNSVAINTVEGFPILLASNQFNRNIFDAYMPRAIAPKHKWKWDNLENEKTLMTPAQIKRDSHTNNCIISLVSSLDIWTQLCMRKKYEEKYNKSPIEKKNEKQSIIGKELKEILESRELPTSSSQIVKYIETPTKVRSTLEFPSSLGLAPTTRNYNLKPAVLSGEWVRPRCYVCCACGVQTRDSRALASHISNHHPNAQIQHYEIVGEVLLKSDILKHLYVPPSQINNRTRPLRGFKECTKCKKSISLDDLHQHMLDCAGDTPTTRRKCRYRPFGMRKKRPRLPDNTIRKKMRKDIRSRHSRKKIRSRQKIRTEVGDAETIRKMLADLPAKRHRVVVNQLNPNMRPRRKLNKQRNKLVIKKRMVDEVKKKTLVSNFSHASVLSSAEPKKGSSNQAIRKPIKRTVKGVASKLMRHKDSLTKKTTMTRSKRKGVPMKQASQTSSDTPPQPTDAEGDGQNQQRSSENNSDRSNSNEGSHSGQERSSGSKESDNRNNPSGTGGENNNSENASAPTQHVPLKHSIDRLTATNVSNDDCGLHKLLIIQKHYNELLRFLPPEERMLFENEAIVIKLDKPPLHFDHQEFYDPQMFHRGKFNKRKGLNDCIAMLKNKLVEPRSVPPMGHFSVQCGTHEPIVPQAPMSDRRYSTTDMSNGSIHRSMLTHYRDLDRSVNDTRSSGSTRSRVTRRSYSARGQSRKEKYSDDDINNEYMQWKLYYDSQMYAAQRNNEQYTRNDSSLLRPMLPTEELMMRNAMAGSLDLLNGNHLINFPNYSYITPLAPQKSPRKSRCESAKSRSKTTKETFIASDMNSMNLANLQTNPRPRRNCRRKTEPSAAEIFTRRTSVTQNVHSVESNARGDNLANIKATTTVYPQRAVSEDRANRVVESSVVANNIHQVQTYHSPLLYQNAALMQYPRENDLGSIHYRLHSVEHLNTAPLDLSNKSLNTVEQQHGVRYVAEQQSHSTDYDTYRTLDLSKRSSNQRTQLNESQINRNDISNVHINYDSHLNNPSGLTALPSIENSLTNLSLSHTGALNNETNYYPIKLTNKKTDETNLYEKRRHNNVNEMIHPIQDRFHPLMHADYINNLDRVREDYLAEQGPTDLSSRRHKSSPIISATLENRGINDDMLPDLSANSKETEDRIYLDSERIREYYQTAVLNNKGSSTHDSENQLPLNCTDASKMINVHCSTTISPQANNNRLENIINYSESTVHRSVIPRDDSQNIANKLLTTTSLARDDCQNIASSNLKATKARNCDVTTAVTITSSCNSDIRNEITNSHIDIPLSSSTNLASNSQECTSIDMPTTRTGFSHIHAQQGFVSPNASPCQKNERSKSVNSNNTNYVAPILPLEPTETIVMSESSVSSSLHKLKSNDIKRFHVKETQGITEPQKHIPKTNLKQVVKKGSSETESFTTALDHDIETARKIAMLPKELVDIIDNIPVDHRNQLLSVLPQYVSTSSSPASLSNINKNRENASVNSGSNCASPTHIDIESENQNKSDSKLHEGNKLISNISESQTSQFTDSSPTVVTSSILLTPSTPQLSDSHSKSQETNETNFLKCRRKSLHSNVEQTPLKFVDSEKLVTGSNLPLIKRLKLDENFTKDRIIDLTIEEGTSEKPDTYYNPDPSVHMIPLPSAVGTNVPKTFSDKTASLRAVRIKTPSERNKAIVPVSTETKVTDDQLENRITTITNPVQQKDIISIPNPTISRSSPISSVLKQTYKEDNLVDDTQEPLEKEPMIKSELEKNDGQQKKQNFTSSSFKDMNDIENGDGLKQKNKIPEKTFEINKITTSKKNETESDILQDTDNSIRIVMSENPVETPPIFKDKVLIENEDSEDDVSLAVIVKQRNRDIKLDSKNNNDSCRKKKKKIKKLKVSKQIAEDKSSQDLSGVILTDNVIPYASTDLTKKLSESSAIIKDTEVTEDLTTTNAKSSKKKIRKGRKVNNANMDHDKIYHSIAENEINKENNLSPEVVKNMDEDIVKSKSPETDTNRSVLPSKMVPTMDKEVPKNEKVKTMELSTPYITDSSKTQECNRNSDTIKNIPKKEPETSALISCNDKVNSSSICTNFVNQDNNSNKEVKKINTVEIPNEAKDLNSPKKADDIKQKMQSNEILFQNKSDLDNISSEDHDVDQKDETSMSTPLRRSRRGKSLFIDNSSIIKNTSLQTETSIEHRTPLTKKQLIFSKLLLDEENHNKLSINRSPEKPKDEITPDSRFKDSYEFTSESEIEKELDIEDKNQNNKRIKSQQFKKKCKKQKPMTNLQPTSETSEVKTPTISIMPSNAGSPTDDIVSVPHVTSQAAENYLTNKDSEANNEIANEINIVSNLPIGDLNKQKAASTEKRKSSSPPRFDLLSSLQPKKTKLNDEDDDKIFVSQIQDCKVIQKEAKLVEDNGGVTAIVVSRNIPCYNKPVPRRARSKSVVVKSSGADLYDPYDINLEDMVEKTEPFVRKEMTNKMGLNLLKSSIADKTRNLSKTAPAAIIDISPSECSGVTHAITEKINEVNKGINVLKDLSVDSDESSKSDVPLKKYVEEKERKLSEESKKIKGHDETKGSIGLEKSEKSGGRPKPRKKNKRVQSTNKKDEKTLTKEDTEEELRSEQFMESFGFFSERKPRKSNLLATKKISETFHIIGNDSDDNSFGSKEFLPKTGANETKKDENIKYSSNKKPAKRGRKKKSEPPPGPSYCDICKKAFRRSDNYLRHQVSLIHISKLSEVELNLKTVQIEEEPNYLIAYKQQLDRLKVLQNKIAKRKKNCLSTADIILPTLEEILADVKRTIREQQLSRRGLSRDQELFIDCCEMLKESHKNDQAPLNKRTRNCNSFNCAVTCQEELALLERSISDDRCDIKCDGDVDSITAKNILESEEVRNLENDLIFNLKEANKLKGTMSNVQFKSPEEYTNNEQEINYEVESHRIKSKPQVEVKDKMYPDEEIIDMFEDKFDKIKRKCRSQAAAAKQVQTHIDAKLISHKNKKKSEKKKGKKSSKKCQGTVPTKGALKGFDGIKVSILTSEINLSAIVPPVGISSKKKKKGSRKKRDRKYSNESGKSNNNDHCSKGSIQKKADVYEFIDTEDTELFEFRPSTLMERFKSISNKEAVPSTSKTMDKKDLADLSSESASDGDDFVYMSDDYVCSDDETENSMVSCELGSGLKKNDSPLKRKDVMEKNAVMGKIFKNNAVRSERKSPKRRESPKPKANLDQLFDSLLQEEHKPLSPVKDHPQILLEGEQPSTSRLYSSISPKLDAVQSSKYEDSTSVLYDKVLPISKDSSDTATESVMTDYPSTSSKKRKSITPPRKLDLNLISSTIEYKLLAPMRNDHFEKYQINKDRPSTSHLDVFSKKYEGGHSEEADDSSADEDTLHREHYPKHKSIEHTHKRKPHFNKNKEDEHENNDVTNTNYTSSKEVLEDAGVARQRARRKCTVGKQNVLAETWSSESEPDGRPPRPNSAESVIGGARKKRGRKKDMSCGRKVNRSVKKPETESMSRPRSPCYWSEGEEEQEHPQQHGWIVGDSHKKLVTMLAHAKGRKRHEDKRQLLE